MAAEILFYTQYSMHEVTPRVVAIAVRIYRQRMKNEFPN